MASIVGGRYSVCVRSQHEKFRDEGICNIYDQTSLQAKYFKAMVQKRNRTCHLGPDFLQSEHTSSSNYACGDDVAMNDTKIEECLIILQDDRRVLASLHFTSLFPRCFSKITRAQADKCVKGNKKEIGNAHCTACNESFVRCLRYLVAEQKRKEKRCGKGSSENPS